jgi:hypothetical protein
MSETNGQGESRLDRMQEQLERVQASHVKLMTDHEVAWAKHEKFVEEQDREWERQKERWREYDLQRQEDRERGAELDDRIAKLVSGIGAFIANVEKKS